MANLDLLLARKASILTELATMVNKPDYQINGQGIQWGAYRKGLLEELQQINELINVEAPFEIRTIGL